MTAERITFQHIRNREQASMSQSQLTPSFCGIVVIATLMLGCGAAFAEDTPSANFIVPGCRNIVAGHPTDPFKMGLCNGLISGLHYMSNDVCAPAGATEGQTVRVVVQYIDARPARMHEDFRKLAVEAMKAAWPCKR